MSEARECPSGNGTIHGYSVEVRCAGNRAVTFGDLVLDERWQQVHFRKGHPGVPTGAPYHSPMLALCGLMSYPAAEALRWWLHAEAEAALAVMGLESRIVKHSVRYSYGATRESEHKIIGGEDRSSLIPDWGVKKEPADQQAA